MRTYGGKDINNLSELNYWNWLKQEITCDEICSFKKTYNKTEQIIVRLLQYYFGESNKTGINIFWCPRYKGINGCNQELDITIEKDDIVLFGLSIKSQFGGGYLEPNDLTLPVLLEHKEDINRFEIRGSINDVLQDIARIMNIKESTTPFKSVTILFSKPNQKKWVDRMRGKYSNHEYLFLSGNNNSFFSELERIHPDIIKYKVNR